MTVIAVPQDRIPGQEGWPASEPGTLPLADLIGADLKVPLVPTGIARYVNLDYAASTPALRVVAAQIAELLPLYSSVHRG